MRQQAATNMQGSEVCAMELDVTRTALVRYRGTMAGVVRSMGVNGSSVEDVVHDAFEMACRKAKADRPDPRDETRFLGWLCALAKFAALTARNDNARNREVASPTEDLEAIPEPCRAYIGHYDDKIVASVVLANLSDDDQTLLREHFFEDKTVKELATERGVPWTTMRSRLDGVIDRARTVMSDKSGRRRALGALVPLWLLATITDIRRRFVASWSPVKSMAVAASVALVVGGTAIAAVYEAQRLSPVDDRAAHAVAFPSNTNTAEKHAVVEVEIGLSLAGFAPCTSANSQPRPETTHQSAPRLESSTTSLGVRAPQHDAASDDAKSSSRAIVPWGIWAGSQETKH